MQLFSNFTQPNLDFEPSFVGIRQVLREIWLLNINFKLEILGNLEFLGYPICQQTVHKITKFISHFKLKSKWEGKTSYFLAGN